MIPLVKSQNSVLKCCIVKVKHSKFRARHTLILEGHEIAQQLAGHFRDDFFGDPKMAVPANRDTV